MFLYVYCRDGTTVVGQDGHIYKGVRPEEISFPNLQRQVSNNDSRESFGSPTVSALECEASVLRSSELEKYITWTDNML